MPKVGGNIITLPQLMAQNSANTYVLRNKKGGASESVGLDYSAIKYQGNNNGPSIERGLSLQDIPNRLLASEQVSAFPLIQKFTAYGTPSDVKLPFSYHGDKTTITGGSYQKHKRSKKTC